MAQQQQQALHAAGGNMYMGGGGMATIGGMHQMHQRLGYPRTNNQRPPNVSVGPPDGLGNSIAGRGTQQEWRHVLMQQQGFQAQMRSQFNQQGHQGKRISLDTGIKLVILFTGGNSCVELAENLFLRLTRYLRTIQVSRLEKSLIMLGFKNFP